MMLRRLTLSHHAPLRFSLPQRTTNTCACSFPFPGKDTTEQNGAVMTAIRFGASKPNCRLCAATLDLSQCEQVAVTFFMKVDVCTKGRSFPSIDIRGIWGVLERANVSPKVGIGAHSTLVPMIASHFPLPLSGRVAIRNYEGLVMLAKEFFLPASRFSNDILIKIIIVTVLLEGRFFSHCVRCKLFDRTRENYARSMWMNERDQTTR